MNYIEIVIGVLGIAAAAGGVAAWFKRGEGQDSLVLARGNIVMYKDREHLYLQQIADLKASNIAKDQTILEQRSTIKTMVKEFKDYKNDRT